MDFERCGQDKHILELLGPNETILLSALVYKYNHVNKRQQRIFLLTNQAIYNIGKSNILNNIFSMLVASTRLKRKIGFDSVIGITVSRYGYEFVVHVSNEHDYRYSSTDRKEVIIENICGAYCNFHKKKMAFYFTDDLTLTKFCTTKIDLKDKKSKLPKDKPQYLDVESLKNNENAKGKSETIFCRENGSVAISIQSFFPIKVLGKGAFGKVMLCQKKGSKQLYAIKSMRKQNIIQKQQLEKTKTQRKILEEVNHPFLISLQYSFQTKQKLFFVMKFIRGGELFQHLYTKKRFSQQLTKFYTAQIVLALHYLHTKKYIYRDLKPENVLINEDGYVILTDFGMAKYLEVGEKAYSFAGTPQYIAPEIIKSSGHDKAADWWSLGILVYEMLVGVVPFFHHNQNMLFNYILERDLVFKQDVMLSQNSKQFIKSLLVKSPSQRLGSKSVDEIKSHVWFSGINWDGLIKKTVKPPYIPKLTGEVDVTHFGKEFTSQQPEFSYVQANMFLVNKFSSEFENMDYNTKAHSK